MILFPSRHGILLCRAGIGRAYGTFGGGGTPIHRLYGTGTTGGLIEEKPGLSHHRFMSGLLGDNLQIGAAIAENKIDILIFFWDPLQTQPHDVDAKALLRMAIVYNIPLACDRSGRFPYNFSAYGRKV